MVRDRDTDGTPPDLSNRDLLRVLTQAISDVRTELKEEMHAMEGRLMTRIDGMDMRIGGLEAEVGGLETEMEELTTGMVWMERRMGSMENTIHSLHNRVDVVNTKVDVLIVKIDRYHTECVKRTGAVEERVAVLEHSSC